MLLASIMLVLVLVAAVFSALINDLHQQSAEDDLEHGIEILQRELVNKSERLLDSRRIIEQDESIIASVNLVTKYQKIDDYQSLLFNPEKEALSQVLLRELQSTDLSFIAIYTESGEPIAFYNSKKNLAGYISYEDSKPVAMGYKSEGASRRLETVPPFLNGLDMHLLSSSQGVHLRFNTSGKELILESSSPLVKSGGGGNIEAIGWLRIAYRLDQKFVKNLATQSALSFAFHSPSAVNKEGLAEIANDAFLISSHNFNPAGYHFDEQMSVLSLEHHGRLEPHYVHGGSYYTAGVTLLTEYSGKLTAVFALSKSQLSSNISAFQQTIFWALLMSGLLVIPVGILFTRRSITTPINALVSYAENVGYGDKDVKFESANVQEFNYLGENLQSMVNRLHESQTDIVEREKQVSLLLDSAGEGIYGIDANGLCTLVNPKALEMLGYCQEEFIGKNVHELMHHTHDDGSHYLQQDCPIYKALHEGIPAHVEGELFWRKDGTSLISEYRAHPIHSEGKVVGSVVTFADITLRKQIESNLELAKNIIENANEAILVTNMGGIIEQVNDAYVKITGYSREEAIGATPKIQQSGRHDQMFYAQMWKDIHGKGYWEGEIWDRRKNGEIFPKWLSISTVNDEHGNPSKLVGIFSDISSLKETEKELENLAYYDALTGLPNRVLFRDRLKQGIHAAKRDDYKLATLLIDLDHFKFVNDTLGHDAGDNLLEIVAECLKSFVRESDTVARLGGDEFTIILSEINQPEEASIIAQKIIDNLKEPIEVKGRMVNIGASIGISTYPDDGDECDLLLKNADMALYKAKDSGRNAYHFFSEELQSAIFDHISMEDEMRKGIDNDQFVLHYQPKINLKSGKMIGMEALVRWNHPDKGFVRPDHFIPFAEETGLIIPMGLWIFKTACRELSEFNRDLDVPLKVAINLSAAQFKQRGLIYTIKEIIEQYGIAPENVELEITESSVMGDVDLAIATMKKFRDLGLKLSIDDFGTGYSSLSYLKRFPINTLKIDQSFVRDLTIDSDDAAIVQAIISMAKNLQLDVVAEGVETEEQLAFLQTNHCEHVQGYLFSKPLPAQEFQQYIKDNLD